MSNIDFQEANEKQKAESEQRKIRHPPLGATLDDKLLESHRRLMADIAKPRSIVDEIRSAGEMLIEFLPGISLVTLCAVLALPFLLIGSAIFLVYTLLVTVSPKLGWVSASAAAVIIAWLVLQRLAP